MKLVGKQAGIDQVMSRQVFKVGHDYETLFNGTLQTGQTNPDLVLEPGDYCVVEKETVHAGFPSKPSTLVVGLTSELLDGVTIQEDPASLG